MPIDYSKSKIYRIVCNETGEQYFGSTTQSLAKRMAKHKSNCNECMSRQIIERGNYDIVLCEEFPCENKAQLNARERKWIEENQCVNKQFPGRTKQEWYQENRDKVIERYKLWREENYEKDFETKKNWVDKNLKKVNEYKKEWALKNREKVLKAKREHYQRKKEEKLKSLSSTNATEETGLQDKTD